MTHRLRPHKREGAVAAVYLLVLLAMAALAPAFYQSEFAGTWVRATPLLVAAIGMTLVIVARHIDISVGSQFSLCGVVMGLLAQAGVPIVVAVAITVLLGLLLGAINGLLVAIVGLPSIVVTLAMMVVLRESLRWARQGEAVRGLPADFQWLGGSQQAGEIALLVFAAVVLTAFAWGLRNLSGGRAIYAVGSDAAAARLAGIKPRQVTLLAFIVLGGLVAVAAVMNAVRFPQVDVNAGNGMELAVIAAVVVGGTAINGGRGTLIGTLVGVALLTVIGPALTFLHLPAQWERAVQGLIILAAVASDRLFSKAEAT